MSKTVIKIENLSKSYRLGQVGTGTISHDLNRWWHKIRGKEDPYLEIGETNDRSAKGQSDYVNVLNDINLEVKEGEILGIIGKNGAGKSTLLKILSKVTGPTTGSIKTRGRIASLLEVGTGFHPELTGRENIYMNGTIMGMSRKEISSKLEEIVNFAGVKLYLDTPVKRYSSGMTVRLGFAIAAHLEPDILVVDEVLAVGDIEFQRKAIGKMKDVRQAQGRSILFVSHNMAAVASLCNRAIVLNNGTVEFEGDTTEAIEHYYDACGQAKKTGTYTPDKISDTESAVIVGIKILDEENCLISDIKVNESCTIEISYEVREDGIMLYPNIHVMSSSGDYIFVTCDSKLDPESKLKLKAGNYISSCKLPAHFFNSGSYSFGVALTQAEPLKVLCFEQEALVLHVGEAFENDPTRVKAYRGTFPGVIRPLLDWEIKSTELYKESVK
jgi:lipopolysaccharide transport system ATP-binding protein